MKKMLALVSGLILFACIASNPAIAAPKAKAPDQVNIIVDISDQSMTVEVNGRRYVRWKVSTAREGYYTPRGTWRPFMLKEMHYSRKYDNSPMPNSIFFLGGYAIHATYYTRQLGQPASHGCVRLDPQNAKRLYALVQKHGLSATRITITN